MPEDLTWKRSNRCTTGACVEIAVTKDKIYIRDSNRPNQMVFVTKEDWQVFTRDIKEGNYG